MLVGLSIVLVLAGVINAAQIPSNDVVTPEHKTRVPITLGVMSRCPDALLCESVLNNVFEKTWDIIDVNLTFIAKIDPSEPAFGVTCLHGEGECRGNIHELCAMTLAHTQPDWWEFVQCLNFEGTEHVGEVDLSRKCAEVTGILWADAVEEVEGEGELEWWVNVKTRVGMRTCIEDRNQGLELLKRSAKETAGLGVTTSCSILITGKIRCIHDSDWKQCETGHEEEDFLKFIQDEYTRLNP
ncbi:hypothetical protein M422DRAFT_29329 [Sphaerobolus stellatus SS14]|nr:hypothetical protein M422DRAFT_29329 [Sphaerobolus stellatus SS14]